MKYINGKIFINGTFHNGSFEVINGKFQNIRTGADADHDANAPDAVDLENAQVIPGLIDIHNHGNSGFDFSTCDLDGLKQMASYLAKNGITAFAPASMTMPYDALEKAYENAKTLHDLQADDPKEMSRLIGINMEGPYFSHAKRGAQNPAYLKDPDYEGFLKLNEGCGGLIKLADVAPELDGAMDFIRKVSRICTVSVAHTAADYETVIQAFEAGATHLTHLFNGMNEILHRAPGPACAAFDTPNVFAELICDGIHVAPPVIRMVFSMLKDRVVLISDSLACCGMPDGKYDLGEQTITLKNKRATLDDGTLAGSSSNLFDMLQNVVSFGVPMETAILSATINPARQIGAECELGSIEDGKKADFLICSENLLLKDVYLNGHKIKR